MSSYAGRHAELYDIIYRDKPYVQEALFVHSCFQKHTIGPTKRILEIACGTGAHAFELEKKGYQIVATDYSPDVLAIAQRKAKELASRVEFRQQDMRSLVLGAETFDAAYCLFDSIGYVTTNEAVKQTLQGIHTALRRDGLFLFEFWHAAAMLRSFEPVRVRRWPLPDGELLRIAETTIDPSQQTCRVSYTLYELRKDGRYSVTQEVQMNRYFLVQEMTAFLSEASFVPVKWFAGFSDSDRIDQTCWHVVAIARKRV